MSLHRPAPQEREKDRAVHLSENIWTSTEAVTLGFCMLSNNGDLRPLEAPLEEGPNEASEREREADDDEGGKGKKETVRWVSLCTSCLD